MASTWLCAEDMHPGTPSFQLPRAYVHVAFARAGKNAVIEIPEVATPSQKEVVFRAFGRVWARSASTVRNERRNLDVTVTVPAVRVPTVFTITPPDAPGIVFAELVAYPAQDVAWDQKVVLLAADAPGWFLEWSGAVGLPITRLPDKVNIPADLPRLEEGQRALLILGRGAAEKQYVDLRRRCAESTCNLMVFDAEWDFTRRTGMAIGPGQLTGPLAGMAQERWAKPLDFSEYRFPNRILTNRWPMTRGDVPAVEVVGRLEGGPWITWAGLPWYELLGRRAEADATLLAVLRAAAAFQPGKVLLRRAVMVQPQEVNYDPKSMSYCPALACVNRGVERIPADAPLLFVVDLRQAPFPARGVLERLEALPKSLSRGDRVLLLGDAPVLDQWAWLRLNRAKKTIDRPEVVWLADSRPWDKTYEIPVMQALTDLGVLLAPPGQEEKQQ